MACGCRKEGHSRTCAGGCGLIAEPAEDRCWAEVNGKGLVLLKSQENVRGPIKPSLNTSEYSLYLRSQQ